MTVVYAVWDEADKDDLERLLKGIFDSKEGAETAMRQLHEEQNCGNSLSDAGIFVTRHTLNDKVGYLRSMDMTAVYPPDYESV